MQYKLLVYLCAVCVISGSLAEDSEDRAELAKYIDDLKERVRKETSKPSHTEPLGVILDRYSAGEEPATVEVGNTAYVALLELFETPISDEAVEQAERLAQLQRHLFESERAIDLMLGIRVSQQIDDYVLYEWAAAEREGREAEFTQLKRVFDSNAFPAQKLVARLVESCCEQLQTWNRQVFSVEGIVVEEIEQLLSGDGLVVEEIEQAFSVEGLLSGEVKIKYTNEYRDIYMAPTEDPYLGHFREDNATDYLLVQSLYREQEGRTQRFILDIYERYSELSEIDWDSREAYRELLGLLQPILQKEDPPYLEITGVGTHGHFIFSEINEVLFSYGIYPPEVMSIEAILDGEISTSQDRRAHLNLKLMPFTNDSSSIWSLGAFTIFAREHGTVTPPLTMESRIPKLKSENSAQESSESVLSSKESAAPDGTSQGVREPGSEAGSRLFWYVLAFALFAIVVALVLRKRRSQLPHQK